MPGLEMGQPGWRNHRQSPGKQSGIPSSGLTGWCSGTSPDARSRKGPTMMTKPQAETWGTSAASQPQACQDGVRVSAWVMWLVVNRFRRGSTLGL
ncbi:uncharacterized protein LOC134760535 isoform X3 [Pongo abelii]|uniref:uncharacterized protein LOC134760535 isoform X3 n=1 Tax=Pongo abelii TaxID=9601 RepID=UPI003003B84C